MKTSEEISIIIKTIVEKYANEFKGKKDAKGKPVFRPTPVENFLISMGKNKPEALANYRYDAQIYGWSGVIRRAIEEGINAILGKDFK
jgi:hypothetical protein